MCRWLAAAVNAMAMASIVLSVLIGICGVLLNTASNLLGALSAALQEWARRR